MQWVRYLSLGLWIYSQVEPIAPPCLYKSLSPIRSLVPVGLVSPREDVNISVVISAPLFLHREDENTLKLCRLKSYRYFAPGIPGLGIISIAGRQNISPIYDITLTRLIH
ncbi:hypothetical protein B9Z19DRAFT_1082045 [Tuber borchii]|uniref:Uncharacterized protein n=1 Tax=Tuber borchii TaxID=42251 RepID=A0A2T6ZV45_TUBBO|nr:hypothetical protein B9Z19DRAFT_1082045 [Tuber borchii]